MESKPPDNVERGLRSQPGIAPPVEPPHPPVPIDVSPQSPATPAETSQAILRLGAVFSQEPELISACLQGLEQQPPEWTRLVLGAAELALAGQPGYADLYYHASRAALAAGEHETAARLLEQALRVNPGYHDALVLAARVDWQRGQTPAARKHLEAAVRSGADYPDVHVLLGNMYRQEGDWLHARQSYQRALALNAGLPEARAALAELPPTQRGRESHELPA
jgi:tetratricopeptide (TPR) repeat protein